MSDAPTAPRFSAATSTRLLDHAQLEALCADYDGFLLDLWGVVMDGTEAFPGALAARIDTLWLGATGIHREALGAEFNGALDEERVRSLLHGYPIRPHFAAPGLV